MRGKGMAETGTNLRAAARSSEAPPFPFLADTFLPLVNRMGPEVTATLEKPGFYPAGGGRLRVDVRPCERLEGLEIHDRGKIRVRRATALVAHLPRHIGERELRHVRKKLGWAASELHLEVIEDSVGPGNVLFLQLGSDALTETFTGFGEVGVRAESVAQKTVREARRYLKAEVPSTWPTSCSCRWHWRVAADSPPCRCRVIPRRRLSSSAGSSTCR